MRRCWPSSGRRASARRRSPSRSPSASAPAASGRSPSPPTRCRSTAASRPSPACATAAEQARLEHRLVSILPVDARFSAGEYAALAHAEIDGLLAAGARPIVVGGTGLYLRAALADLVAAPAAARRGPRGAGRTSSSAAAPRRCTRELARRAPWAAEGIEPRDRSRIVRALELLELGELEPPARAANELWTADTRHPTRLVGLVMDREALYARIDARVDAMVAAGAVEEVRAAHAAGASHDGAQGARASRSCWPATSRR